MGFLNLFHFTSSIKHFKMTDAERKRLPETFPAHEYETFVSGTIIDARISAKDIVERVEYFFPKKLFVEYAWIRERTSNNLAIKTSVGSYVFQIRVKYSRSSDFEPCYFIEVIEAAQTVVKVYIAKNSPLINNKPWQIVQMSAMMDCIVTPIPSRTTNVSSITIPFVERDPFFGIPRSVGSVTISSGKKASDTVIPRHQEFSDSNIPAFINPPQHVFTQSIIPKSSLPEFNNSKLMIAIIILLIILIWKL